MTLEEFTDLKQGDVVRHKTTGANYVILTANYSTEVITQKTKDSIEPKKEEYEVLIKTK